MRDTRRLTGAIGAIAALVLVTAVPAAAQQSETFEWSGRVEAGDTVQIRNVNGRIDARPASGSQVEIVAEKKGKRDDPATVRIEVVEHAGGVVVCALYEDERAVCRPDEYRGKSEDSDVKVDFAVRVPRGVHVDASTVNGGVDVDGVPGDARVQTVNGSIEVSASGTVEAKSVNGSIEARGGSASWSGALDFETVNGSITLTLPDGVGADVSGKTVNGSFTSDFGVTIEAGRPWGPKRFSGTIGSGGGELRLETVNGAIALRKG